MSVEPLESPQLIETIFVESIGGVMTWLSAVVTILNVKILFKGTLTVACLIFFNFKGNLPWN